MQKQFQDQSQFFETQATMQAPPEELERIAYIEANKAMLKRKRMKLVGLFLAIVLISSVVVVLLQPKEALTPPPPPPTPTPIPVQSTELDREIERLQQVVEAADPLTKPFAPPPVDMEVDF